MLPPPPRSTLFPYTTLFRSSVSSPVPNTAHPARPRDSRETVPAGVQTQSFRSSSYPLRRFVRGAEACASRLKRDLCRTRSEEHTSELQSLAYLVCRLLLEKK